MELNQCTIRHITQHTITMMMDMLIVMSLSQKLKGQDIETLHIIIIIIALTMALTMVLIIGKALRERQQ